MIDEIDKMPRKMRTRRLPAMFRPGGQQALLKIWKVRCQCAAAGRTQAPATEFTPVDTPTFCYLCGALWG